MPIASGRNPCGPRSAPHRVAPMLLTKCTIDDHARMCVLMLMAAQALTRCQVSLLECDGNE